MSNVDYLPKTDGDLLVWFNNFHTKLVTHGPTLGFLAADVTSVTDDYNMLVTLIHGAEVFRNQSFALTAYKTALRNGPLGAFAPAWPITQQLLAPATIVPPGIVPRLRALVQRIKTQPAYTESMGTDLGIIGPAVARPVPSKPPATASLKPDSAVSIDWVKSIFDGVLVEGQRAGETVWTSLGIDLQSPFTDDRSPLQPGIPEVRRYRLRYLKGDEPTGDYSDVITTITTP